MIGNIFMKNEYTVVSRASVTVESKVISSIERGLMILVGITQDDKELHAKKLCVFFFGSNDDFYKFVLNMRLWPDAEQRPWKTSIVDQQYKILFGEIRIYIIYISTLSSLLLFFFYKYDCIVSQFTLYARMKGTKPDYSHAMNPKDAKGLYDKLLEIARQEYAPDKIAGFFNK
ncbi:hypothetical protein RFI_09241 [Reticulomyxa filosa]|uniref:D-aminoacyl-tRNA deacylase n=1 Tax=Reticulomyxa filosa TaxID=46433 RepID=X6NRE3_RETFI|nr:hypothetical protein RFI_09241 [Reticulomyxa filosa]|eukprot:ETO27887.1 hypothetical protein RFI_09241 [Reticulomyxa filosa]